MQKTYKREAACVVLAVYLIAWAFGFSYDVAAVQADALKASAFTFAGLAFAADTYVKQVK
jgi:hypothetical protein